MAFEAEQLQRGGSLGAVERAQGVVPFGPAGEIVAEYRGATPVYKAFKYTAKEAAPLLIE